MTEKIPKQKNILPESDKYRPHNVLGTGGMKVVVRAEDLRSGRDVAMAISKVASERNYTRFLEEARITASLEHPNIVPVHEVGVTPSGSPFFTMKIVHGYTLEDILDKLRGGDPAFLRRYTLRALLDIFLKVCDAIAFAHSKGIIHLDLKPSNIQVGDFGEVLVLDWGIARRLSDYKGLAEEGASGTVNSGNLDLTLDGVVKGTPEYMAPEQAAGRNSERSKRTDIYALGAILYTMLTWNKPFSGSNTEEIIANVLDGNIIPPHEASFSDRRIPQALEFVIYKAMERSPVKRYYSVTSLKIDVLAYLNGYATQAEEAGFFTNALLWLKRKKVQVYVFVSIFLLVTISGCFLGTHLYFQSRSREVYGSVVKARQDAEDRIAGLQARIRKETSSEWNLKFEDTFADSYLYERWGFFFGEGSYLSMRQAQRFVKFRKGSGLQIYTGASRMNMAFRENIPGSEMRMLLEISWNKVRQDALFLASLNNENLNQGYLFAILPGKNAYIAVMRGQNHDLLAERPIDLPPGTVGKFDMIVLPENGKTTLKMSFNGQELINIQDAENHALVSRSVAPCILAFANMDLTIHSVKLMTLGTPMKADLLDIADRLIRKGSYEAARQLYVEAEESASSPERRRRAAQGVRQTVMLLDYRDKLPEWRKLLQAAWPGASVSLSIEQLGFALLASGKSVSNLAVLADMPLSSLILKDTGVLDLTPLKKMKMNHLTLERCEVPDPAPLAQMDLSELVLKSIRIPSLPVMKTAKLKSLTVMNCGLQSVESLRGLRLEYLNLARNDLSDISPIAGMPLSVLNLAANQLDSISALAKMPLRQVDISENRISSLEPLRGKELQHLLAVSNGIQDVSPLAGMPLESLNLAFNRIESLHSLQNLPNLHTLNLIHNRIDEISVVSGFSNLTRLHLDYNRISKLTPLRYCMNLRILSFSENRVENLTPLRGLKYLRSINCSFNPVRSAEPIALLNLNKLFACNTKIASFQLFFRHPPKHFLFGSDSMTVSELEQLETTLAGTENVSPALLRSVRVLLAYRKRDAAALRGLATEMNGGNYVFVPILAGYHEARKEAFLFGADFPSWGSPLERNALIRMIESPFWMGLRRKGNSLVWPNGSEHTRYLSRVPDVSKGCIFAPSLWRNGVFINHCPDIKLPLVLVWH